MTSNNSFLKNFQYENVPYNGYSVYLGNSETYPPHETLTNINVDGCREPLAIIVIQNTGELFRQKSLIYFAQM